MVKTRSGNIYTRVQNSSNEILSIDHSRSISTPTEHISEQNYTEPDSESYETRLNSFRSRRLTRRSYHDNRSQNHPDIDIDFDRHNAIIRLGTLSLRIELVDPNCMLIRFDSMRRLQSSEKPADWYEQSQNFPNMIQVCPEFEAALEEIAYTKEVYDINELERIFNNRLESSVTGIQVCSIVLAVLRSFDHMQVHSIESLIKTFSMPDKSVLNIINNSEPTCSICLTDLDSEASVSSINRCGHFFHKDCITHWLSQKLNCPLCRQHCTELFVRVEYRSYNI